MAIEVALSRLHIESCCRKSPCLVLIVKSFGFISRFIAISFHVLSCTLNAADRENKLRTKNSNRKALHNLESKTKSIHVKLNIKIKV